MVAERRDDLHLVHFHHTPFATPDELARAPRPTSGASSADGPRRLPRLRVPHRAMGRQLRGRRLRRRPARSSLRSGSTPTPSSRRPRPPDATRRSPHSTRCSATASSSSASTASSSRRTCCAASMRSTSCWSGRSDWRGPGRLRRALLSVTGRGAPRTARYRDDVEARVAGDQRPMGRRRAGRRSCWRPRTTTSRSLAALRRADVHRRQPGPRRAQPRGEGGDDRQRAGGGARAQRRGPARGMSCASVADGVNPFDVSATADRDRDRAPTGRR